MCPFIFIFSFLMNEQQKCKTAQQHFVLKKYNTQKYSFLIYSTYSFIWLIFNKSIGEQCVHCTMYKEEGYFNYLVLIPCNYGTSNPLGRLECPPLEFGLVVYTGSDGEEYRLPSVLWTSSLLQMVCRQKMWQGRCAYTARHHKHP